MTAIEFGDGQKAIVQVYDEGGCAIIGTGFWLGGRYALTCAHVVTDMVRSPDGKAIESSSVRLAFDKIGKNPFVQLAFDEARQPKLVRAKVIYYHHNPTEGFEDVAVLRLEEAVAFEHVPIRLPASFGKELDFELKAFGLYEWGRSGSDGDGDY